MKTNRHQATSALGQPTFRLELYMSLRWSAMPYNPQHADPTPRGVEHCDGLQS